MNSIFPIFGLHDFQSFLGAVGSFLLLIPPALDQLRRLALGRYRNRRDRAPTRLKFAAGKVADQIEEDLGRWRWWESLLMSLGALFLMMSFWF